MTPKRSLCFQRVVSGAAIAACLAAVGCKEEPKGPGKLFEEEGAYELVRYDLTGGGLMEIFTNAREAAFLMRLHAEEQVAQLAMCAETEEDTPDDSLCRVSPPDTAWFCSCFSYAYEEDRMLWRPFAPGMMPPKVEFMDDGASASASASATDTASGSGGGGGDVDPAADTNLMLAESLGVAGEFIFTPLPVDVFGSDGISSRYVFQQKSPTVFDQVFTDPDSRPGCQPCIAE